MAMRIINIFLLLSLTLLLTSCYPGYEAEVTNNSEQNLVVVSLDTELKATSHPVERDRTVRVEVWYKLQVQHGGGTWNYEWPAHPLPKNYGKKIGINMYYHRFQIEKDGSIYVLPPDTRAPTTSLSQQPEGYPIRPE
jgi:hypothetical protein